MQPSAEGGPRQTPGDGFISAYAGHLGLQVLQIEEGLARIACPIGREHLNLSGVVHGGLLLSMLDHVGGAAGSWSAAGPFRRSVTLDLNGQFTGQVSQGRLVATGRIVSKGRRIFFVSSEVRDAGNQLVAFGSSTHRWRSESSSPAE